MARQADAQRRFVVEEVRFDAQGTYAETLSRFEWDSKTRSAPRHGWEYGIAIRTNREDYPGSDEPVEQILGAHHDAFTIHGVWDDRWAGEGFAENQRVEFEKMVQRANFVRISFETISVYGIITHFKPTYFTSFRVAYEFTVSPHFRIRGGDTRRGSILAPSAVDPVAHLLRVDQVLEDALAALALAPAPHVVGDLVSVVASSVGDWQARADTLNGVLDGRVLTTHDEGPNSVSRVVQGFEGLRSSASALLPTLADLRTDTSLDYESAIPDLTFEGFVRDAAFSAREMIVSCFRAAQDLSRLVDARARAIYYPRQGESLYGISNRFYGTPHRWRDVADRNRLDGITLSGTEVLIIPDVAGISAGAAP